MATTNDETITFLTLTAPGSERFGATHTRRTGLRKTGKEYQRGCPCGLFHGENSPILGTPIDPAAYDYADAARFNATASRRLAVTMQKLSRLTYGNTLQPRRHLATVRVAEFQKRGLVHFHVIVRGNVSPEHFFAAIRGGRNKDTGRPIRPVEHDGLTWGPQCDIKHVKSSQSAQFGFYISKLANYSVKDVGLEAAHVSNCCASTLRYEIHAAQSHARAMEFAALQQGQCSTSRSCPTTQLGSRVRGYQCRGHHLAIGGWGYRGHVFAASRSWGTTLSDIRAQRVKFATKNEPENVTHLWERLSYVSFCRN